MNICDVAGIRNAISAANNSNGVGCGKYRVGAAIYKNSRLISIGWNSKKTDPKCKNTYHFAHAEFHAAIRAIRKIDPKYDNLRGSPLKGYKIYIARIGRSGGLKMSKPCSACQDFLKNIGIKKVCYTNKHEEIGFMEL